jgi:hypothetical protein
MNYASVGDKSGDEHDDTIAAFRTRFETIIKTDGEDSGLPGGRHSVWLEPPPPVHLSGQGAGRPRSSSEKPRMCKVCKERAIDGVA